MTLRWLTILPALILGALASLALIFATLFLTNGSARADRLTVDMTTPEIAITSNFTGATITLFGAIQKLAEPTPVPHPLTLVPISPEGGAVEDIIVVIKGPPEDITVRRKERVAGIWVNTRSVTYRDVPGFYFVASTRPIDEITDAPLRARNEIGAENIDFRLAPDLVGTMPEIDAINFRKALIRRKSVEGLYGMEEAGVKLQDRTLFNMNLHIPANVPIGEYVAQVLLLRDGKVISSRPLKPRVEKSGVERWVYTIAHSIPFVYGVFAVILALVAGWLGSLLFRQSN